MKTSHLYLTDYIYYVAVFSIGTPYSTIYWSSKYIILKAEVPGGLLQRLVPELRAVGVLLVVGDEHLEASLEWPL